jgi:hypothetical protein
MKGHLYHDLIVNKSSLVFTGFYTVVCFALSLYVAFESKRGYRDFSAFFEYADVAILVTAIAFILCFMWLQAAIMGVSLSAGRIRRYAVAFPQGKRVTCWGNTFTAF